MFGSGECFCDSEMLAHLDGESGTGELELEDVGIVIVLFFADDLEFGLDRLLILPGDFSGECELWGKCGASSSERVIEGS